MGKSIDDPAVVEYQKKFPYHKIVPTERNTVAFQTIENDADGNPIVYTVEAMMAMVLAHAREIASNYAEGPIVDAVIAVPSTWGQAERLSVAQAAELGGIKLHQLMNDNTAVALHYGVFHRKEIESKPMVRVLCYCFFIVILYNILEYYVLRHGCIFNHLYYCPISSYQRKD